MEKKEKKICSLSVSPKVQKILYEAVCDKLSDFETRSYLSDLEDSDFRELRHFKNYLRSILLKNNLF